MIDAPPQDFVDDVLRLIHRLAGEADWYRLDRALTYAPHAYGRAEAWDPYTVSSGLMPAVRRLECAGLITTRENEHRPGRPHHTVTDAGREHAHALAVAAVAT